MSGKVDRRKTPDRRSTQVQVPQERRNTAQQRRGVVDRRRSVRTSMDLWVEESEGEDLYFRRVGNLSMGGVFFENALPHKPGTRVTLKFSVPGHERIIETPGEVVNIAPGARGVGMGVKFLSLHAEDAALLDSYMDAVAASPAPAGDENGAAG